MFDNDLGIEAKLDLSTGTQGAIRLHGPTGAEVRVLSGGNQVLVEVLRLSFTEGGFGDTSMQRGVALVSSGVTGDAARQAAVAAKALEIAAAVAADFEKAEAILRQRLLN